MFLVMANVDLCSGFKTLSAKETKSTAGDVTGRPEQWLTVQGHEMKHRSVGCSMILSMGVNNKMCKECATLKHNSGRSLSKPTKEVSLNSLKHKRESYMNREELAKLDQERKSKTNAKRREDTLRMKLQSEFQKFSVEDDQDFRTIFDAVSSDITDKWKDQEDMMILWDSQRKALQSKGPSGRRWHPKVIRVCLSTWTRSPKAYETLRKSGMLILPSGRLLKMYKNSVSQKAGFNDDVLEWMVAEAKKTLGPEGYDGGIIFDEMQIQEDLQLQHEGDETKLIGLVDLGDESDHMKTVIAGIDKAQIASHVLQMVFLVIQDFDFHLHISQLMRWMHHHSTLYSGKLSSGSKEVVSMLYMLAVMVDKLTEASSACTSKRKIPSKNNSQQEI
ncbi:uncharacterized protein [Ptychodera flava]|uniref:uncharacterized protein n=1 Tax=Ptychodera flava TaxID=63121 RepID=UPI00396A7FF3